MNQKIKELMRKIDTAKTTIQRLSLLEELDVEVTKYRKEQEQKFNQEKRIWVKKDNVKIWKKHYIFS